MPDAIKQGAGGAGHGEVVTVGHFEAFKADIQKLLAPLGLQQEWDRMKAEADKLVERAAGEAEQILADAKLKAEAAALQILEDAKKQAVADAEQLFAEARKSADKIVADAKTAAAAPPPQA